MNKRKEAQNETAESQNARQAAARARLEKEATLDDALEVGQLQHNIEQGTANIGAFTDADQKLALERRAWSQTPVPIQASLVEKFKVKLPSDYVLDNDFYRPKSHPPSPPKVEIPPYPKGAEKFHVDEARWRVIDDFQRKYILDRLRPASSPAAPTPHKSASR